MGFTFFYFVAAFENVLAMLFGRHLKKLQLALCIQYHL